jgi:hypothetical protein
MGGQRLCLCVRENDGGGGGHCGVIPGRLYGLYARLELHLGWSAGNYNVPLSLPFQDFLFQFLL